MLDASLQRSYFTRTYTGKIVGMDSSLGWHSEDQGVFMINQDYKQSESLKKELQDFELSILAGNTETGLAGDDGQDGKHLLGMDLLHGHDNTLMDVDAQKAQVQNTTDEEWRRGRGTR